uniref:Uncharacterized protein n=1 Tax=Vespula pensylvanica TaxID=30213 RepID=A0A834P713_VESPE|nr:hypothetical protein H0235_004202 [Vespula pensylvanica]
MTKNSQTKVRPGGVTFVDSVNVQIPGKYEDSENEERRMKLERRTGVGSDGGVGNVGEAKGVEEGQGKRLDEERKGWLGWDKREEKVFKLLQKSGNVSTWPEALPTELKLLKSMAQKSVVAGAAESILLDESNNISKVG